MVVGMVKTIVCLCVLLLFGIRDGSPQSDSPGTEQTPEGRQLDSEEAYVFYESARASFKLHRTPAPWRDARLVCYDEGAELASPDSQSMWIALSQVLQTSPQPPLRVFTGINNLYDKGFFNSLGGTPLQAMPARWAPGKPDNANDESCLVMQRNGLLLDSKCEDTHPYICYKRHPPNQDTICGTKGNGYVYEKTTKSCYKFHTVPTTWPDAYAKCAREGGYLAIINSNVEGDVIKRHFPEGHVWAHIGYTFWRKDLWVTIHGQTLAEAGFERWANGEPNNYNTELCGAVARDATLNDLDCHRQVSYLCEKKPNVM